MHALPVALSVACGPSHEVLMAADDNEIIGLSRDLADCDLEAAIR